MKCPKCGYNSFEYYDICKKCSADQSAYKKTYSINSLVLPLEAKEKRATEYKTADSALDLPDAVTDSHEDIFSFDLPEELPETPPQHKRDPFNFDEPAPNIGSGDSPSEEDIFANLLESTSQSETPPAATRKDPPVTGGQQETVSSSSHTGEFDLESFSWDEPPASSSESGMSDDFDSLFGEKKDTPTH